MKMNKSKFIQVTFLGGIKSYVRATAIVQLYESEGKTYVYTINDPQPMKVRESMDEILAKIEGEE